MNAIADEKLSSNHIMKIKNAPIIHASQYPIQITTDEKFDFMVRIKQYMRTQVNEVPESHKPMSILEISRNSTLKNGNKHVDGTKTRDEPQETQIKTTIGWKNIKELDGNFIPVSYNSVQPGNQTKMIEPEANFFTAVVSDMFTLRATAQRELF